MLNWRGGSALSVSAGVLRILAATVLSFTPGSVGPVAPQSVHSVSNLSYHVVHDWPTLPENIYLAEVSSVGVDSKGNVFVLMRGGRKWPDSGEMDQTPIPVPTIMV